MWLIVYVRSFHSSGAFKANLTGGLARMTELMNATESIKTPSLTIYFVPSVEQTLENVRRLAFSRLIWVELDDLVQSVEICHKSNVVPDNWYMYFAHLIDNSFNSCEWFIRLRLDPYKLWRHQIKMRTIVRRIQEEIEINNTLFFAFSHESIGILDIWIDISQAASFASQLGLQSTSKIGQLVNEQNKVHFYVHKVVLPNVLSVHLSGVEGIKDCYYTKSKGEWRLDTKGGKLKALLKVDCVDGLRSRSNNLYEIYELFGIEATKQFLRDEFGLLIKVNPRHLELLIDSMTVSGAIQRVARYGIDRKQVGTIAKASFEQPVDNFLISASSGEVDPLKGVSSAITVGKLAQIGSGFMDVILNPDMLKQYDTEELAEKMEEVNLDDVEVDEIEENVHMKTVTFDF